LTSNAAGKQKGTAIGTLSVARQIGLTISPTIFGAFIQQGFSKLGSIIPEKLMQHGINPSDMPEEAMHQIKGEGGYSNIQDRKSTRLNSSHVSISYVVFSLTIKKYKLL